MHCNKDVSKINLAEDYTEHLWDIGEPFLHSFSKRNQTLPIHVQIVCGISSVWDLLKKKPYLAGVHDDFGRVPLMVNWHDIAYKRLLRCGADPNAKDINGNTVLIYHRNNLGIIETFVKAGADINATNNAGESLISMAMEEGLPVYPLVRLGATLPTIPRDKKNLFFLNCLHKEPVDILSKAFADFPPSEDTYLSAKIWAACFDNEKYEWLKALENNYSNHTKSRLSKEEEKNFLDALKSRICEETPARFEKLIADMTDCLTRRTSILSCIRNEKTILDGVRNYTILEFLIRAGADPNLGKDWKDNINEVTPLYRAVSNRDNKAVKLLLRHGADPNTGMGLETCVACAIRNNDLDILRLLMDANADLNFAPRETGIPVVVAIKSNNLPALKMLVDGGATLYPLNVSTSFLYHHFSPEICEYYNSMVGKKVLSPTKE